MVSGGPARWVLGNPAMLEGPRSDRHAPDKPRLIGAAGSSATACGKELLPVSEQTGLRRRPRDRWIRFPWAADRFRRSQKWRGSTSTRPEMGSGGWKNLLAAQTTAFDPLGKTGKPTGWNLPAKPRLSAPSPARLRLADQARYLRLKVMAAAEREMMPCK